jgi:formamidopyrimidine-DNA glycosylase
MPEGPETFIVGRQLKRYVGQTLEKIESLGKKKIKLAKPIKLIDVKVRGKQIVLCFEKDIYLGVHFMLTGRFGTKEDKNVRHIFYFGGVPLYFSDARNFAHIVWMNKEELKAMLARIGPSIMNIDEDDFIEAYNNASGKLATVLHNQQIVSGIGNYLRAEAMYRAKLSPLTKVESMTKKEIASLYTALKYLVNKIVSLGGTHDYADLDGNYGAYTYKIYGRAKTPKNEPIKKLKINSQTVYFV